MGIKNCPAKVQPLKGATQQPLQYVLPPVTIKKKLQPAT